MIGSVLKISNFKGKQKKIYSVFGCGRNDYGHLGLGNTTSSVSTLKQVLAGESVGTYVTGITQIACGYHHSLFIK